MSDDTFQPELRWQQRLANYERAVKALSAAVALFRQRPLSDLEKQGVIQAFEFTHKLAWNVMKDYFFYQGNSSITGSRDATREAFAHGLLVEGEAWMEMIASRNKTSNTNNQAIAEEIVERVVSQYHQPFSTFLHRMNSLKNEAS